MLEDRKVGRPVANPKRRKKILGRIRMKLSLPDIPGYVCRIVNDDGNRINDFLEDGWEFVYSKDTKTIGEDGITPNNKDLGTKVSTVVGTKDNGQPLVAYAMKLRKDWKEQNDEDKYAAIDENESQIKRGRNVNVDNSTGSVKIQRGD